jgi:hypothetical protein
VEGLEDHDNIEEIFKRRMTLRNYFKDLKMNITKIKKSQSNVNSILNKRNKKAFKEASADG